MTVVFRTRYDGGSADPDNLVKIMFIEVVFDHNSAGIEQARSGAAGAVMIDG